MYSSYTGTKVLYKLFSVSFLLFKVKRSLTDSVELDAAVSQLLRVEDNFILGLSVSDQDTNSAGLVTHSHVGFEIVLVDVAQSHSCMTEITK